MPGGLSLLSSLPAHVSSAHLPFASHSTPPECSACFASSGLSAFAIGPCGISVPSRRSVCPLLARLALRETTNCTRRLFLSRNLHDSVGADVPFLGLSSHQFRLVLWLAHVSCVDVQPLGTHFGLANKSTCLNFFHGLHTVPRTPSLALSLQSTEMSSQCSHDRIIRSDRFLIKIGRRHTHRVKL